MKIDIRKQHRCPNCGGVVVVNREAKTQRCKRCETTWTLNKRNEMRDIQIGSTKEVTE